MARAGRSYPNRPVVVRHPRTFDRHVALGAFETVSEWPPLTVATPNARFTLTPFETTSEWPPLTFGLEQNFTLAPFETVSEWPPLTVDVPVLPGDRITEAGQVEWNGTLWGPGTAFRVQEITGWRGLPTIENLNVARPTRHGAWDARKLAQQRIVGIRLQLNSATDPAMIDDLLDELDAVTGIPEDETPLSLVIKAYGAPHLATGQIIDRDVVLGGDYNVGQPTVSILIACADPRRYNPDRSGVLVPVGATVQVGNAGNTATHPEIRIDGPVENPVIVNATLDREIAFALVLDLGERLTIDTIDGNATVAGDSVMSTLTGSSAPVSDLVIAKGTNAISYTADSGGNAGAVFLYRDAWI